MKKHQTNSVEMNKGKVLLTENFDSSLAVRLNEMGYECAAMPGISYEDLSTVIEEYAGVIVATRIAIDVALIERAKNLRFIARAGSGMERIQVAQAEKKGIACLSSPEGNANSVGEHALGLLLAMLHHIPRSSHETARGQWLTEQNRVHELEGKTLAVIGYGNTGRAFAQKLKPMNMRVLAYDKYLQKFSDELVTEVTMEAVFEQAEALSLHVPLTNETEWMVDDRYLQRFARPIYLINTSRGKIIRHQALLNAIDSGKVVGAACDVFENENFAEQSHKEKEVFERLVATGKVIFTPHIAGKSFESGKKISDVLIRKIRELK